MSFFPGQTAGQPMAPLFACQDRPTDDAYYTAGGSVYVTRIPVLATATNGDLLCFVELRTNSQDYACQGIALKRSTDDGASWGEAETVYRRTDYASNSKWVSLGSVVVNANGRVICLFSQSDGASGAQVMTLWRVYSDDHGATWSAAADITTGLKKVNSTTPAGLPACYDKTNAAWGWCMFGPHTGICKPFGGQLIIPCNHRYTPDQTGIGYSHCVLSDDDGATWYLGGGFLESPATNEYTNELAIGLLNTGDIYGNMRFASGGNASFRGQVTIPSNDIDTTWPNVSIMTTGSANVGVNSSAGSVLVASDGDVYVSVPNDASQRSRVTVFRSTDNGATFPEKSPVFLGYSGYSHLIQISAGNYGIAFEATDDYANAGATDGMISNQFIRWARFDESFVTSPPNAVADFHFNDGPLIGALTNSGAATIGTWSGFAAPGKGGAGASWHASGLSFSGAGAGVQLQEQLGGQGGICDPGLGDITYEVSVELPPQAGTTTLFDNRNNSGRGVTCTIDLDNFLSCTVHDGTTACTATQTVPFADPGGGDYEHTYHFIYKRGTGLTIKFSGSTDPVTTIATTADTLSASLAVYGSQPFRLGSRGGGTVPLEANTIVSRFRVTKKALTDSELLAWDAPKLTPAQQSGYNPSPTAGLPSTATCKLALFAPQFGGTDAYGSAERWGGISWPYRPAKSGTGIDTYYDQSSLRRQYKVTSSFRQGMWLHNTAFGQAMFRPMVNASASALACSAVHTDYDFIQNTGVFTIIMVANFVANTFVATHYAFDNRGGSNAPGVSVYRSASNGTVQLTVTRDGTNHRINDSYTGGLTDGTTYFLAWVGFGTGAKVKHYKGTYSAGTLGTVTPQDSTSNLIGSDGTYNSTLAFCANQRADDSRYGDILLGPLMFFTNSMDATAIGNWAAVMNKLPTLGGGGGRPGINLGLKLGL